MRKKINKLKKLLFYSNSVDGLIAASFYPYDKDIVVEVSSNSMVNSLFRPDKEDLQILSQSYGDQHKVSIEQ